MKLLLTILFLIVLVGVPLFEQIVTSKIRRGKKTPYLLNKNLKVHYEQNSGMMMGIFKNNRVVVLVVTTVLMILILSTTIYLILFTEYMYVLKIGLILVCGGAFSNALERYIYKYVIDYISFPKFFIKKVRNVIFNVADFFVFIGAIIVLIGVWFI